jgi:hypothetical protein
MGLRGRRNAVPALVLAALLLSLPCAVAAEEPSLPPGERPVVVQAGFFLVNLSGLAERSETFDADLYLNFRWRDPRLAFAEAEPQRFLEEAAVAKLAEIWWPQIEFVNTAEPGITNRSLQIFPDGAVEYEIGVSSDFRADLDLRRFPFDRQTLEARIESFLWNADDMVFAANPERLGFNRQSTFEGLAVTAVSSEVRRDDLVGWGAAYSTFVAKIDVERQAGFYVWSIFTPVILIFLISCTIFVVPYENFHDRVGVSLAALLACIATQFAISFNLPQIPYLTVIDRVFLVTFACIALGVLIGTAQAALLRKNPARAERIDRLAGLGLPLLFLALLALCVVL